MQRFNYETDLITRSHIASQKCEAALHVCFGTSCLLSLVINSHKHITYRTCAIYRGEQTLVCSILDSHARWNGTFPSSEIQRRLLLWKSTGISEEHIAFIFSVEDKEKTSKKRPVGGGDMLLQIMGWLSPDHTALCPRRQNFSNV
jgi:hypothetical protein